MRVPLIYPHLVRIVRVDPTSIEAEGDGGEGGFDDDFREPILETVSGRTIPVRRELDPVDIPAQIEPGGFDMYQEAPQGSAPQGDLQITLSFSDLEDLSLVDDNGRALLRTGDRLVAIYDMDGVLAFTPRTPLYIVDTTPDSWFGGPGPSLLIVTLSDRPEGAEVAQP